MGYITENVEMLKYLEGRGMDFDTFCNQKWEDMSELDRALRMVSVDYLGRYSWVHLFSGTHYSSVEQVKADYVLTDEEMEHFKKIKQWNYLYDKFHKSPHCFNCGKTLVAFREQRGQFIPIAEEYCDNPNCENSPNYNG